MTVTDSGKEPVVNNATHSVSMFWLLLVAGLFVNLTLTFGDSGRILLLSVFDVVIVLLFAYQLLRLGLQWHMRLIWPLISILVIFVTAVAAFYFGEDIKIAGLLRETIKYLGFVVGVMVCGLLYRGGTLPAPRPSVMIALGVVSLLIWYLQRVYFLTPDKSYLAVNNYSNACLGLSVLAMYLLRDRLTRRVLLVVAGYQACVLVGCLLVKTTSMSVAALLIMFVTVGAALNLDRQRGKLLRFVVPLAGSAAVGFVVLVWTTTYFDTFISTNFGQGFAVRLALWKEAGSLMISHFPYGIGPGQFGELGIRESDLWSSLSDETLVMLGLDPSQLAFGWIPLRFVHNTFLSMILEWGISSFFLIALLIILIIGAMRVPALPAAICYGIYLVPTLLLHDGLGFRANYLILGLGVAAFIGVLKRSAKATEQIP